MLRRKRKKGELEETYEYEEMYDEIDNLLLMLAIHFNVYENSMPAPHKIPPHKIDEVVNVIAKRVSVQTAKQVLYQGLLYLCYHAGEYEDFDKYTALKCYVALKRLEATLNKFDEMYKLCSVALNFVEVALLKYKVEESTPKDEVPEGYV